MKAGLEVHQQLATRKLFCECPSDLSESGGPVVVRLLRATGGEERQVDRAAAFQASRGLSYAYEVVPSSCLVDLDEEPPHPVNAEALDVALTLALLLHARIVDEIEVMRKIVVDGSNTSGFQRTALVAVDGWIEVRGKRYSILTVCLEEDAARKVSEEHGLVRYRLDRIGVPLVEVATGPEIASGEEARLVAEELGALLRATHKVRRGIGTIREDLNVSIEGGTRVEIKGVQELRLIQRYVASEVDRQTLLVRLAGELAGRGASVSDDPPLDVTEVLRGVPYPAITELIDHGGVVLAVGLRGFGGLLSSPPGTEERLGRELADHARASGLRGLVHSDELPNDRIGADRVDVLRHRLGLGRDDAFVLLAAPNVETATRASRAVRERARQALLGVPGETRDPLPDGRARYSRPLPGRDRMYPETDVPPVQVSPERLARVTALLPELPATTRARLQDRYGLSAETTDWLVRNGESERFEMLVAEGHASPVVARLLTQELPQAMAGEGSRPLEEPPLTTLHELLEGLDRGEYAKEALSGILVELALGAPTAKEAARRAGAGSMSRSELERVTREVLDRNQSLIEARGDASFQALMGDVMREVRGRRDGKEVAEVVRQELEGRVARLTSGR